MVDKEKLTYNYSVVEGDVLGDAVEKVSYTTKVVSCPDGGSIVKNTSTYYSKGDHVITEEEIKDSKEKSLSLVKVVVAHLVANHDAYN